ncbi:T9SS type A sorting domain-containing protein [candidate division KSB1 bacterium]|nr:T9SS type A sorting domain-containing protein [candidate division KSB1 bacterium]
MKKSRLAVSFLAAWMLMLTGTGISDYISNIQFSPPSPASLASNQNVNITFDYMTNATGGVRIFVRPFTAGTLTPNYAAHASPLYPTGTGNGTGFFTITTGNAVVDQLRFQVFNANQTQLIMEFFVPVNYRFSSHAVTNIVVSPSSPAGLVFNQNVNVSFNYVTNSPGGVRIFVRPFTGGALTPNYAAHGSPLYATGTGNGTGFFTITAGNVVVDQLRVQMYDANQTQLLLEFFIPVNYRFAAHAITNIQITPPSPASMLFNQNVNLTFDYTTSTPGGVRIFVRPFTGGALTPNYAAHGSPLYATGTGSGTGFFTITAGNVAVERLRFQMFDANQTQLLLEFFLPVNYRFAAHAVTNIQFSPSSPAFLTSNTNIDLTFQYSTTASGGARIFARPFTGGALSPNYAAHGSPIYPVGSGNGSGFFTITSGNLAVDQARFQMLNANQTQLLLEFLIPANYQFITTPTLGVADHGSTGPSTFALHQNHPNPFNPATKISYEIPQAGRVGLKVLTLLGQEVRTLVDEEKPAGSAAAQWDGRDNFGRRVGSGVYLYRLEAQGLVLTKKMILIQ